MSLTGKIALITGAGQDRGIGQAAALVLAQAGATVIATDIRPPDPWLFATGGVTATPFDPEARPSAEMLGRILTHAMDVTDYASVTQLTSAVAASFGGIDIIFNNAGVTVGAGPFFDATDDQWALAHDINVMGVVRVSRAALPHMMRRGSSAIINNASMLGIVGAANYSVYCATKFAVVGLTRCLADEFGPHGVRVNAVCPGYVDTQLNDQQIELLASLQNIPGDSIRQFQAGSTALRRVGTPLDVAKAVLWLAGDDAGYLTGVALPVAGGLKGGL